MSGLRLMTYNMLNAPNERLEQLVAVVRQYAPDILACQEITDVPGLLQLSAQVGMPVVIGPANGPEVTESDRQADVSGGRLEHVALLSRYPIIGFRVHQGNPRVMFRSIVEVWIEIPGVATVRGFVVHLRAFPGPEGAQFKMREAEVLASLLRSAEESPYRFVMGDYNAWIRGVGDYRPAFERYPKDHIAAILGDVTDLIRGSGVEEVWRLQATEPEAVPGTVRGLGSRSPVDHIMVSPRLGSHLRQVFVPDDPLLASASDHLPVIADFSWERPHGLRRAKD